jgi:hypothetical protein
MNGSNRSIVSAIRGPITLITLGVLFALNNFTPYGFHQTWPVLLIVFGLLTLLRRGVEPVQASAPGAPPPWNYPPSGTQTPWNYPPPGNPPGGYRQSTYTGAPTPESQTGTEKGGFGSTAPPRPPEPGSGSTPGGSV